MQRLEDILDHGYAVTTLLAMTKKTLFMKDATIQKAACYDVLCVSEAVARLVTIDPQIVTRHPRIPWRQIADIGNVMRHEYGRVDLHLIWETVCGSELAALLAAIKLEHSASST